MAAETGRIEDLLRAMSLDEKLGQLTMIRADFGDAGAEIGEAKLAEIKAGRAGSILDLKGVDRIQEAQKAAVEGSRLGIPLLVTLDVLHGYETIFPIPLGEAAAFDPGLWEETARAAAVEASANGIALTFAPMLDVARDPRWGRIAESPGEDPWVGSRFAEAKVRGFQHGSLTNPQSVAATAKHFAGYGAVMAGREYASADMSARALNEVHLPPFEAAVRAGVAAIMPAFIDLAGVPMTAHRDLLDGVLRRRWGFEGVIVSDFGAVGELIVHGVAADAAEAAALALNAGIDIDMESGVYLAGLPAALARRIVSLEKIDATVRRVLALKAELGLFENPFARGSRALSEAQRTHHRALARDAAQKSIVLLKNRDALLPLKGEGGRIAVVGPLSDAAGDMLGPWHAAGTAKDTVSFLDGLTQALPGWRITHGLDAARDADAILLCVGESAAMSGEAASRARPVLPDDQRKLAGDVFSLGKPVILALASGRPLIDPWLFERADAALATWFPGSEAGAALAAILTGAVNPGGKLPLSWPCDAGQSPFTPSAQPAALPTPISARRASISMFRTRLLSIRPRAFLHAVRLRAAARIHGHRTPWRQPFRRSRNPERRPDFRRGNRVPVHPRSGRFRDPACSRTEGLREDRPCAWDARRRPLRTRQRRFQFSWRWRRGLPRSGSHRDPGRPERRPPQIGELSYSRCEGLTSGKKSRGGPCPGFAIQARQSPRPAMNSAYFKFWLAVRSNDSLATKVEPHQLEPSPLGLIGVMFAGLYVAV